jgi:uncharacterized protein (TIGR02217 family)
MKTPRAELFMPWTSARQSGSPRFFSRVNLDAAGHGQSFQPRSGVGDSIPYKGTPLFSGDTGSFILCAEEFEYFKAFFNARKGKYGTFLHKNWMDYKVTRQPEKSCIDENFSSQGVTYPVAGNGIVTDFLLLKKYSSTLGEENYRRIFAPVLKTLKVYADGLEVISGQYFISDGKLVFVSPPTGILSFECEYDLIVRFDNDSYAAEVLNSKPGEEQYKINSIPIMETNGKLPRYAAPLPTCDDYLFSTAFLIPLNPALNTPGNQSPYLQEGFINYGYHVYNISNFPLLMLTNLAPDPFGATGTSVRSLGFNDDYSTNNTPRFVFDSFGFVPGSNYTQEFWFKLLVTPSTNSFLYDNRSGGQGGCVLGINENLRISFYSKNSNQVLFSANNVVTLDQWHFISFTKDHLYLDGQIVMDTPLNAMTDPGQYWNLGGSYYNFLSERVQADYCDFRFSNFDRGVYTKPLQRFPTVQCADPG